MRVSVPRTLLLALLALSGSAAAQEATGVPLGPPPASAAASAGGSFGGSSVAAPAAPSVSDAAGLVALPEPKGARPVVPLDDVLAAAAASAADVRIAAERVVQQEANLRRAWAAVLPQLNLSGAYTLTCTGGGKDVVDCADRTTVLVDPAQLEQQANLFEGIASLLGVAAAGTSDPAEQQKLLDQQTELDQGAAQVRQAAKDAKPVVIQPANVFSGSLTMSLPLFNGRAFPLLLNAYDAVEVAGRAKEQVKQGLLYSAVRAYYGAVAAKKLVAIAAEQVDGAHRHTEATRARVEAATQPPLALKRAELDELRARQQLEASKGAYDVAVAGLGLIVGRTEAFDVEAPRAAPKLPEGTPAELAERALSTRADVAAERLTLGIARRGELDAWMMFMPTLSLVASAHATSFTSGFLQDPITGSLAVTATVPLYDGGLRYAALKDSASKIREEKIRAQQLEDRVRAEVLGNARDIPRKEAALALAQQAVDVAKTAHGQAEASFQSGVGTSLDVSDTSLALFVAENDLAKAELDLDLAKAGLAYVVGALLR